MGKLKVYRINPAVNGGAAAVVDEVDRVRRAVGYTCYLRLAELARRSACARRARVMGRARKLHDIADLEARCRSRQLGGARVFQCAESELLHGIKEISRLRSVVPVCSCFALSALWRSSPAPRVPPDAQAALSRGISARFAARTA